MGFDGKNYSVSSQPRSMQMILKGTASKIAVKEAQCDKNVATFTTLVK